MSILIAIALPHGLVGILIGFLIIVVAIVLLAGLIYLVEEYIMKQPLPAIVRLVIGLIVLVILIIWLVNALGIAG